MCFRWFEISVSFENLMGISFQKYQILWDFISQCEVWHVWLYRELTCRHKLLFFYHSFSTSSGPWLAYSWELLYINCRKYAAAHWYWLHLKNNHVLNNVTGVQWHIKPLRLCNWLQLLTNEPQHEISNNVVCATSKSSDQPAHTRSLIRAFASRLNILWVLSYWPNIIWNF